MQSDFLSVCKSDDAHVVRFPASPLREAAGYTCFMARIDRPGVVRRLRAILAELGVTVPELAERIGAGEGAVYNWVAENPKKPNFPPMEAMAALCDELPGLTLDYIYRGKLSHMTSLMAFRLTAREMGKDPDAPDFQAGAVAEVVASRVA